MFGGAAKQETGFMDTRKPTGTQPRLASRTAPAALGTTCSTEP